MRVRIVSEHPGEVDGVPLSAFQVGLTYEVSTSIGTYLIAMRCAELVVESSEAAVTAIAECVYGVYAREPHAVAADRGSPSRRKKSRKPS